MRVILILAVLVAAVGVAIAGVTLRDKESGDIRARFDAAVGRAQEADAKTGTIKLAYEFADPEMEEGAQGSWVIARRGDEYQVRIAMENEGQSVLMAIGEDGEGPYFCMGIGNNEDGWAGFFGEPGCVDADEEGADSDTVENNDDFLDTFTGGFTFEEFLEHIDLEDATVTEDGEEKIAGLKGDCYRISSEEEGDARVCFEEDRGLVLLVEWEDEEGEGRLELKEYSDKVSDEDLARIEYSPVIENDWDTGTGSFPTEGVALTSTKWMAKQGAVCPAFEGFTPVAIAIDEGGQAWVADRDRILVTTDDACSFRNMTTGYEDQDNNIAGIARGPQGSMIVSLERGQVIAIEPGGRVRELLAAAADGATWGSDQVSAPASFADGSIAVVRIEDRAGTSTAVLYRVNGTEIQELRTWEESFLFAPLLTVPGVGVAMFDDEDFVEVVWDESGAEVALELEPPYMGFSGCRVYESATSRWELFVDSVVHQTAAEAVNHSIDAPAEDICESAAMSPDGLSLWYIVSYPEESAALYEVDLSPAR